MTTDALPYPGPAGDANDPEYVAARDKAHDAAGLTLNAPMNPDCEAGKHRACAGDAWDEEHDERCSCACRCHTLDDGASR